MGQDRVIYPVQEGGDLGVDVVLFALFPRHIAALRLEDVGALLGNYHFAPVLGNLEKKVLINYYWLFFTSCWLARQTY